MPKGVEHPASHFWKEWREFFGEFRRHFHTTGAILPSSRFLAQALAAPLKQTRQPGRVLEVGPGTGSVTKAIANHLGAEDRLEAVEINERFVLLLRERLQKDPAFASCRDRIQIIHAGLEKLPGEGLYDFVVSGLPFNNFPVAQVREIFGTYRRLLKPGGILSFFEYTFVRELKSPFVSRHERQRLSQVGRVVSQYVHNYQVRQQQILINVPPATVRYLRFPAAA
jgi:phosphatidylethanolamine/phosphatidyl-N-methylethanolamine N-methyltransferase